VLLPVTDRPPADGPSARRPAEGTRPPELFDVDAALGTTTRSDDPGPGAPAAGDSWVDEGWADDEGWTDDGRSDDGWSDDDGWEGGDHYVEVREDRPGGRRWLAVLLALLVVVVLVLGAAGLWVRGQVDPGDPGEEVALTIPSGATTSDIARLLADREIITNATIFEWYLRFAGGAPDGGFKAGDYTGLRKSSAMGDVVDVLERGPAPPPVATVTIREGLWVSETKAAILEAFPDMDPVALDAAIAAVRLPIMPFGVDTPEGVLFPATYEVPKAQSNDPQLIVDQIVAAFERVSATQGLPEATVLLDGVAGQREITPYEALTVASMVEAEARTDADRPKIARVIYNRLAQGMRLDIDATVLYGLGDRHAELTQSQLNSNSPYNTRRVSGLPPTPINSPGEASIEAALHPADGKWLFYVLADAQGNHEFTETLAQHEQAVARAREKGLL
jgi:UPF0755 protein